jgi:pantoate--beta-alanine ligase
MILLKKTADLVELLNGNRKDRKKIGFVPTMGALHAGHISLVETAEKDNDLTVCSIFVNPTQFNDPKDFEKYPMTLDKDIYMLEGAGCDVVFVPPVSEIYPHGTKQLAQFDLGYIETILEGKYRPGHFQGVSAVVHRLLEIVMPDRLYIGQKDYQQCMVIERVIELAGWAQSIDVVIAPTQREPDGLAMSSRNMRLTVDSRKQAVEISKVLLTVKKELAKKSLDILEKEATETLTNKGFKVDYIAIADAKTLQPVNKWNGKQKLVALAAAYLGEIRLIDNMLLN